MTTNLNHKLVTGAAWMLLTRLVVKTLGLISTVVLARLLLPEDFGLVAVAMSIYAFILLFGSVGFNSALIQKTDADDKDFDVVWTIGVCFGVLAATTFALSAEFIAMYFNEARLTKVIYCVSLLFLTNGFVNTGVVKFQKELNFRRELKFQIIPKLVSFTCTLTLAFLFRNYWALIIGMLVHQSMITITSYLMTPYRPKFRTSGFKKLFGFSKWIMLNNLFYYINNRSMDLIVGRLISTRATGIYSIGLEIASLPVVEVVAPINKSAFPVYSKAQNDLAKLKELFLQTISLIGAISIPAVAGLFIVADIMVPVVLGPKWQETIVIIQYISISSLFLGLSSNAGYLMVALGKPHMSTFNSFIRTLLLIPSAIIMIDYYGLTGAAMGMVLASIAGFFIAYFFIWYYAKVTFADIFSVFIRPLVSGLIMITIISNVKLSEFINLDLFSLTICIVIGMFAYFVSLFSLWFVMKKPRGVESFILGKISSIIEKNRVFN